MDIYLNPEYMDLVIEVNKLKEEVANKIAEKNMLSLFLYPEIKYNYILKLGKIEADFYLANLNFKKLKRRYELYKNSIENKELINNEYVEKKISEEFKKEDYEYFVMQEDISKAIEYTKKDKLDENSFNKLNNIYKELMKYLNPNLNRNNSILKNRLFEVLEVAYKNYDLKKMLGIKDFFDSNIEKDVEIDEFDELKKLKEYYLKLLSENRSIIFDIRTSEVFANKGILDNEILIRRKKDEINAKLFEINQECLKLSKDIKKFLNKNN